MNDIRLRRSERGVALIWAILIMIVVLGTLTLVGTVTLTSTDETRDAANRTRSTFWAQAASDDLIGRIKRREIGFDVVQTLGTGDVIFAVPQFGLQTPAGGSSSFPVPGAGAAARPLVLERDGDTFRGWYQVLPPEGLATGWQARHIRNTTRIGDQGALEFIVRVWEDGMRAEPVVARMTFRHASYSRFSLLADDVLRIGLGQGMGGGSPGGYVHSNNSRNGGAAILIEPGTNTGNTLKFTSSRGTISGCPSAAKCAANIREVVEFGAAARAMDAVEQLSLLGPPRAPVNYAATGIARVFGPPLPPPATNRNSMPVWWVRLDGAGCSADQLSVWNTGRYGLRRDTVGVPMLDDLQEPVMPTGAPQCVTVAEGGGAFRFNGDVVVSGQRASARPVTIFARRDPATFPLVSVDLDGDGLWTDPARVTAPASIYMLAATNAGRIGSTLPLAPVGLVADGGVYLPSHAMEIGDVNHNVRIHNVAAMAAGAEVAYGPSMIAVAADAGQPGLGLSPADAQGLGFRAGIRMEWHGSIASRRQVVFRYGTGNGANGHVGYMQRRIRYVPELLWNAPPSYPSDREWHMTDYEEFRSP